MKERDLFNGDDGRNLLDFDIGIVSTIHTEV